ncbi:hypothetical protein [Lacicoccus alkaliphilus]|uniref:Uncharacterized protein n=1 Tax=Lacicoccus alkaliphilus DSM 16010 TaxID=1123231 RepID=A0A1M7DRX4_9BACL|nr:hypothetical protein [Salinicoccus alkaliphilus]SHL82177.1 hypothetical protein SAMN02745189_00971 [Salinicoccus alkaliphilus DSM 16010]
MESYKKAKEDLLKAEDYRSFAVRSRYLPGMLDKESAHFKDIQETYREEGFNHLSAVELCRSFIRVDLMKLSLMQSTHGIFSDGEKPYYPMEHEVLDKFTLNDSGIDFHELQLPEDLERISMETRNKIIEFTKSIEPFLQLIEKQTGDFNETFQTVMGVLVNDNPHILSKVYDDTYYETVLNYNIDNAFEKAWKDQLVEKPLVSFYAAFTLARYDNMFKSQLT